VSPTLGQAVRVAGGVVVTWAAVLLAVVEAFLVPLRVFGVLVGVAVLLAVGGNVGLTFLARYVTASRWGALLPGLAWFLVTIVLAGGNGGDVIMPGNSWVPLTLILCGSISVAISAYLAVVPRNTGEAGSSARSPHRSSEGREPHAASPVGPGRGGRAGTAGRERDRQVGGTARRRQG
jgi:hypothetical protein